MIDLIDAGVKWASGSMHFLFGIFFVFDNDSGGGSWLLLMIAYFALALKLIEQCAKICLSTDAFWHVSQEPLKCCASSQKKSWITTVLL